MWPSSVGNERASQATCRTYDLVQDAIMDCSVVASLCALTARTERGHSDILISAVYPYDQGHQVPAASGNGKYFFRFHFNGCYRKVVIDDRLPTSRTSRALHVIDRNNPGIYWPALIEKAYLKVRGGYDFPGSNSGTDLWVLTGWIPEQLFLQRYVLRRSDERMGAFRISTDRFIGLATRWTAMRYGYAFSRLSIMVMS